MIIMESVILNYSDVDVKSLRYNKYKNGMKLGSRLYIQTPMVRCPFGISQYPNQHGETYSLELDLSKRTKKTREFRELIQRLDANHQELLHENSAAWHNNDKKFEYKESVKNNILRVKLPTTKNNAFITKFYNESGDEVSGNISKNCDIVCIVELTGIWTSEQETQVNCGANWNVSQCRIIEKLPTKGYSFVDEEDEDGDISP